MHGGGFEPPKATKAAGPEPAGIDRYPTRA